MSGFWSRISWKSKPSTVTKESPAMNDDPIKAVYALKEIDMDYNHKVLRRGIIRLHEWLTSIGQLFGVVDKNGALLDLPEKSILDVYNEVVVMHGDVTTMHEKVNTVHGEVTTMHGKVNAIHSDVVSIKASLETMQGTLDRKLTDLHGQIGLLLDRIPPKT